MKYRYKGGRTIVESSTPLDSALFEPVEENNEQDKQVEDSAQENEMEDVQVAPVQPVKQTVSVKAPSSGESKTKKVAAKKSPAKKTTAKK